MSIGDFLAASTRILTNAGIATARLDCLVLLEDALGKDRASILAHTEDALSEVQLGRLDHWIAARKNHTPLAYIRGKALFFGREFIVSEHVLTPRPETEAIIEICKDLPLPDRPAIADIGAGSGCIGITLALELPSAVVDLYDISPDALEIAQQNSAKLGAHTRCLQSDLLGFIQGAYDVIVTNLPYVPDNCPINNAAAHEPALALFSGADGLDHYRTFWTQTGALTQKPHYIVTESFPSQHHTLALLARKNGYILERTDGYMQLFSL
jgi:release factor glutamine methyltransferase